MVYIGIDNGVSGSIGIINGSRYSFRKVPIVKQQDYTKKKKIVSRIVISSLFDLFFEYNKDDALVFLERPMINSMRFNASISAARAHEATIGVLDLLNFSYTFVDSKTWTRELLPIGTKTTIELKVASFDVGSRLFPNVREAIERQRDADGILIAEWGKRFDNGTLKKSLKRP